MIFGSKETRNVGGIGDPSLVFSELSSLTAVNGGCPIVTYNQTSEKYAVYIPHSSAYDERPLFYETYGEPFDTQSGETEWTRCTAQATAMGDNVLDFIWWNDFYWVAKNDGVYRCPDLVGDQWTKVFFPNVGVQFSREGVNYAGCIFSIIDNKLVVGYRVHNGESKPLSQYWFGIAYISNPYSNWIDHNALMAGTSSPILNGTVKILGGAEIKKIGNKYFCFSGMDMLSSSGSKTCFWIPDLDTITPTVSDLPAFMQTGICSICETTEYYILCTGKRLGTPDTIQIGFQQKADHPTIDMANESSWNFISLDVEASGYDFTFGIQCEMDSVYAIALSAIDDTSSSYRALLAYGIDVVTVPSIALSDEFYTFCKVSENGGDS